MKDKKKNGFMNFDDFIADFGKSAAKDDKTKDSPAAVSVDIKKDVKLFELLSYTAESGASDIHINSGEKPVVRINGDLKFLNYQVFTKEELGNLLSPLLLSEHLSRLGEDGYADFTYDDIKLGRFRINIYKHIGGLGASFRYIPREVPEIEDLNIPLVVKDIAKLRKGLVLITGPTGSGKTTTLAAIINEINMTRKKHIITIEDPLEYLHTNNRSRITHREIGEHANDFSEAIVSALRSDPDVLMIGEMRDLETISQALRASETGVLVLATLHTNSASKAIDRIINVFPADQQSQIRLILSETLCAVISQQLIKRTDTDFRIPATEILLGCSGLSNLVRDGKTFYINSMIQTGRNVGMQSMDYDLFRLYKEGKISLNDARAHAADLKYFNQLEGAK
ncbi:MAG: PilT/PilU family type 4a pilus ATPase [Armatimonadota bacterium]